MGTYCAKAGDPWPEGGPDPAYTSGKTLKLCLQPAPNEPMKNANPKWTQRLLTPAGPTLRQGPRGIPKWHCPGAWTGERAEGGKGQPIALTPQTSSPKLTVQTNTDKFLGESLAPQTSAAQPQLDPVGLDVPRE